MSGLRGRGFRLKAFGLMKRGYGYARVRYRSLVRNATQLQLLCLAINLRRMLVLTA
jgi:IS5 family transposase